jgi:hypothetical protein
MQHQTIERTPLSSPIEKAKRLKRVRNLANLTRKYITEQFHINMETYKGWEIARHGGLSRKGALKVCEIVKTRGVTCTPEWLLHGTGQGPKLTEVFEEGTDIEFPAYSRDKEKEQIFRELNCFRNFQINTIDIIMQDDSMTPYYANGDVLAGIKRYRKIHNVVGHLCIVQTRDGRVLVRKVEAGTEDGLYNLVTLHPHHVENNVKLISAAPVIWIRRKDP